MSHRNLKYVKQDQPSFIRNFRQKAGMKAESSINDKFADLGGDCNDDEKEDEKPVIVVMDKNVTEEDVKKFKESSENVADDSDQKIVFRKPVKRTQESSLNATTKKPRSSSESKKEKLNKTTSEPRNKEKKSKKKDKKVTSSLLSFEDDDG